MPPPPPAQKGSGAANQRACLRCIAKKRRCDHERPVCGSCGKLKVSCEYPPPQSRRGPVPGLSKRAEWRVQQCENALWYLINLPGVAGAVRRAITAGPDPNAPPPNGSSRNGSNSANETGVSTRDGSAESDSALPTAPTSTLDREARAEWWSSNRLDSAADILEFQRACRTLSGEEADPAVVDAPLLPAEPLDARAPPPSIPLPTSLPPGVPPGVPPAQIYTPASSSLRNSMGPSLWQLVTAAIPDADNAGFTRELLELRARRERAVAMAGEADLSPREGDAREKEIRRLRQLDREMEAEGDDIETHEHDRECRRRAEGQEELAVFESAMAREAAEEREYEARRRRDKAEREARERAAMNAHGRSSSAGPRPLAPPARPVTQQQQEAEKSDEEKGEGEGESDKRFPGFRLPLGGVLPNEHLAWTYGASGVGGLNLGGAGKRKRLEDMFW